MEKNTSLRSSARSWTAFETRDFYLCHRPGGLATYHGPGQWVLFPVDGLEPLTGDRRGVRKAVDLLLGIALRVGQLYASDAHIRSGCEMGVWTSRGKFAAVGIHIEQGVLLHGLAVNGYRTPTSFTGLRPCGLDAPVDFLLESSDERKFQDLGKTSFRKHFGAWGGRLLKTLTFQAKILSFKVD